jgi:protoheme IX farnesyltransferase
VSSLGKPVVPSRLTSLLFRHSSPTTASRSKIEAYVALTKPRIIELLLVTTVPTMVLANGGWPRFGLMVATICGGALSAGGANAINMYVDRDIDVLMERTKNRPLVRGEVSARGALVFAVVLQIAAFVVLWSFANLAAALLTLGAAAFYVFVYTLWLKRTSRQNIVIGGAAGAVPVLVGWVAVTGSLSWAAAALFLFMFLWTPPHFWALAIKHADEYRAAGVPMLPAVASLRQTTNQMTVYAVLLLTSSLVVLPLTDLGWIYGTTAMVFGAAFIAGCVQLRKSPSEARAMRLFSFSISYVTVLFAAIVVDVLFS